MLSKHAERLGLHTMCAVLHAHELRVCRVHCSGLGLLGLLRARVCVCAFFWYPQGVKMADRIESVNGENIEGKSKPDVLSLLKKSIQSSGTVTFGMKRTRPITAKINMQGGGMGVKIMDENETANQPGNVILGMKPGGIADASVGLVWRCRATRGALCHRLFFLRLYTVCVGCVSCGWRA